MMLPPFDERPKEGFIIVGSQAGLRFSYALGIFGLYSFITVGPFFLIFDLSRPLFVSPVHFACRMVNSAPLVVNSDKIMRYCRFQSVIIFLTQ